MRLKTKLTLVAVALLTLSACNKAEKVEPAPVLDTDQAKQAYALGAGVLEVNAQKMARDDTIHIPTRDGATLRAKLWAEHAKPDERRMWAAMADLSLEAAE